MHSRAFQTSDSTLYTDFSECYTERITIQSTDDLYNFDSPEHPVLIRRPAVPIHWDPIARPHVALIMEDVDGSLIRYYLSQVVVRDSGRRVFEVADLDSLPEDTVLEVRFNARRANLYRLEHIDGVTCWRWIARSKCLHDFEYPSSIDWDYFSEHSSTALTLMAA